MKKLSTIAILLALFGLAFAIGRAQPAQAASDGDAALTAELLEDLDELDARRPRPVLRFLHRAAQGMVRAVRSECDCGDVKCAESTLEARTAAILDRLPERCDERCQEKVEKALERIAERILERVEKARCEPRGGGPSQP